jgi:Kdo-III transferase WaaZ
MLFRRILKIIRRQIWQLTYPKPFWHMRHYDRRFGMTWDKRWTGITWRGAPAADPVRLHDIAVNGPSIAIIASGPSLLRTPSGAWQGRDIACVNGSILWAREHNLRPRFYVVTDPGFVINRLDLIALATELADVVCLSVRCLFEVLRQDPEIFRGKRVLVFDNVNQPYGRHLYTREELIANPLTEIDRVRDYEGRHIGVCTDLSLGVFAGGTVVLAAAQIAIARGYRDVQFVGLDMKTDGARTRFYEEGKPQPSFIDRNLVHLILPSFEALRRYCDRHGVALCNWSPDSAIPSDLVPPAQRGPALASVAE